MEFILGCNWWASNAGADMWRSFDIDQIDEDLKILSEHKIKHIRAFPNWRDFQPVMPLMGSRNVVDHYCMVGEKEKTNPYYLDDEAMNNFSGFLDVCKKYDIKVIVGLITGWMSGRVFVPPALFEKNLITDPVALYFEQLFVEGFVKAFCKREEIVAWDLGNECNCMSTAQNRFEASSWTGIISNTIKANDNSRPIISGMHSLEFENNKPWRIEDQAFFTDMLTTHPYPYWCYHTRIDATASLRTTMHATAQTKLYAQVGKKPCMAEEIGTMGPMLSDNEHSAMFLRANLFSLWANGASGVMWWCSSDQDRLETFPYSVQCVERELGLLDTGKNPKPQLLELEKFADFLENAPKLAPARSDAVCVLTNGQNQWGIGYMTHILAKQAGMNISFEYGENPIPKSKLYMLPSVNGITFMSKARQNELAQHIREGATLYISPDNGIIPQFEELTGMRIADSYEAKTTQSLEFGNCTIEFSKIRNYLLEPCGARVIAKDSADNPCICVNQYGKGKVYLVNFPLEACLIDKHNGFEHQEHKIYSALFEDLIETYPVEKASDRVAFTCHPTKKGAIVVAINHSAGPIENALKIKEGCTLKKTYYKTPEKLDPFDACVFEIEF